MKDRSLYLALTGLGITSALLFALIYLMEPESERGKLLFEAAKALIQLFAIGIVGALVKMMLDEHQARRRRHEHEQDQDRNRSERLDAFRADKLRRLVEVTNKVRRAPILIAAAGSAETYGEQMRTLLDCALELRVLRHEIDALGVDCDNAAFYRWPDLKRSLQSMQNYLQSLQTEFTKEYQPLVESQAQAEAASGREGAQMRREIRTRVVALPRVRDLLSEKGQFQSDYLDRHQDAVTLMARSLVSKPQ